LDSLYGAFGGVHAFGYNSSESEPIWIKSAALWVHCRGLALADFRRDPRSSDSWRARWNFLSGKQRTISPISRRPKFTKFEEKNIVDRCRDETFWTEFWKFYRKGPFFLKMENF